MLCLLLCNYHVFSAYLFMGKGEKVFALCLAITLIFSLSAYNYQEGDITADYVSVRVHLEVPADSIKKVFPLLKEYIKNDEPIVYSDTGLFRYYDTNQPLIDVPVFGQALPILYFDFYKNSLMRFTAQYQISTDNFNPATLYSIAGAFDANHTRLQDSTFRRQLVNSLNIKIETDVMEEVYVLDTLTFFQCTFSYTARLKNTARINHTDSL